MQRFGGNQQQNPRDPWNPRVLFVLHQVMCSRHPHKQKSERLQNKSTLYENHRCLLKQISISFGHNRILLPTKIWSIGQHLYRSRIYARLLQFPYGHQAHKEPLHYGPPSLVPQTDHHLRRVCCDRKPRRRIRWRKWRLMKMTCSEQKHPIMTNKQENMDGWWKYMAIHWISSKIFHIISCHTCNHLFPS